jgi:Tfp pilus assembly protein PilF
MEKLMMPLRWLVPVLLAAFAWPSAAQSLPAKCGSLQNGYGPYDYENAAHRAQYLEIVERVHFDSGVEQLRGHAQHPNDLVGDLDYTLRAFPNHARALYAVARYDLLPPHAQRRGPIPRGADCYFQRAIAFKPSDGTVRMVYGIYLYKAGKLDEAVERMNEALERIPDSAEAHYNMGLVLFAKKDYALAREHAERAYALGHPMAGLRNKLKRVNAW